MKKWLVLAGFVILCVGIGALAGMATSQSVLEWYPGLNKPSWTPPGWLFAPVWTVLYIMMAVAAWLVWKTGNAQTALILFFGQLLLNLAWSFLFFGARSPALGLIDILALWLSIAATIFAFSFRSRVAAFMMVPYLCWVSFATALNAAIYMLN
jgi:translocator protein